MVNTGTTPLKVNRTVAVWIRTVLIILGLAAVSMAPDAKICFENIVVSSGISFVLDNGVTPQKHQIETMIAGVAVFDYNNDGLLDIYFVNERRYRDWTSRIHAITTGSTEITATRPLRT